MKATIRFVHKISPSDKDIRGPIDISEKVIIEAKRGYLLPLRKWWKENSHNTIGRLREWRIVGNKIHLFPSSGVWHCITIEYAEEALRKLRYDSVPNCDKGAFSIHTPED